MQLTGTIEIDRPIEEVYQYVVDSNNDPSWCRPVLTSELVEGNTGEPGARYRQAQRPSPIGKNLDVQLIHTDPPKHAELRWSTSVATCDILYDLEPTTEGTRITHTSDLSFQGAGHLGRPLTRMMYPIAIKQQLGKLKEILEDTNRRVQP